MAGGKGGEYVQPKYPDKLVEPVDLSQSDDTVLNELVKEVLALRVQAGVATIEQS